MKIYIPTLLAILICCQSPETKQGLSNTIETFLVACSERGQFNGNVLVAKKGEIIFQGAFGKNGNGEFLKLEDQFRLASVSKQFTAMAILILAESRVLDLDDPVTRFIPELPYANVTIRNLLNHTSGLPDYMELTDEVWLTELKSDDEARMIEGNEHLVRLIAEYQPDPIFEPGEKYQYSNTGYVLLATIVERASGVPFHEYLELTIFEKTDMQNTFMFSPTREDPLENRVYGWQPAFDGSGMLPNDFHYLNPAQGDGGLYSTVGDLFKWDRALYQDLYISPELKNEGFSPVITNNGDTSNYGFGWGIGQSSAGSKVVRHSGGWVGSRTYIERYIEEDMTIILLTNNSSLHLFSVLGGLRKILYNQAYELPKLSIAETLSPILMKEGNSKAQEFYDELKRTNPDDYNWDSWQLNALGYALMESDYYDAAIGAFEINVDNYPDVGYLWDSLGDGYLAKGDTSNAITHFEKAVSLDSELDYTFAKLDKIK